MHFYIRKYILKNIILLCSLGGDSILTRDRRTKRNAHNLLKLM